MASEIKGNVPPGSTTTLYFNGQRENIVSMRPANGAPPGISHGPTDDLYCEGDDEFVDGMLRWTQDQIAKNAIPER